jgi:hypothetical protein
MGKLPLFLFGALAAHAVTIHGTVVDSKTREPLGKALVSIRSQNLQATTGDDGRFELAGVEPGTVELFVSTVNYGLLKQSIEVPPGADMQLEIELGQGVLKRSERITVTASPFDAVEPTAPERHALESADLKNLSGMFSDALRSVQSLPGVAAADDYYGNFAVRGAGIDNLGFYLDGVLMRDPFHELQQITDLGSLSILNGDIVDSVTLLPGAFPAKYGDPSAAVLTVDTREPGRDRVSGRANADFMGVSLTLEGPLGRKKNAAWMVALRKSYFGYLLNRLGAQGLALSYYDIEGKLTWDPTPRHRLSLLVIDGPMSVEETYNHRQTTMYGNTREDVVQAAWQYTPSAAALLRTAVNYTRQTDRDDLNHLALLGRSEAREFASRHDTSVSLGPHDTLEIGAEARRTRQDYGSYYRWDVVDWAPAQTFAPVGRFVDHDWRSGAYVQNTFNAFGGRLLLNAGGRFDRLSFTGQHVWSPRAGASLRITPATRVTAAWGRYSQFPTLPQLLSEFRNPALAAQRSTHATVGFDRRIGERVRFKVELYDRQDRWIPFSTQTEWRLVGGVATGPVYGPVLANSLRGYSRGVEVSLQRVSANRLSGWLSYSYGHARYRDAASGISFDGDYDQRHTVCAFASYRVTKTVNLSSKFHYESNFPVVGFFQGHLGQDDASDPEVVTLSSQRNQLRVPAYSRLDFRLNKIYNYKRSRFTLYAEIDNLLDHGNWRFFGIGQYDFSTGQAWLIRDKMLPILPFAGVTAEF